MKKLLLLSVFLTGCASQPVYVPRPLEQLSDEELKSLPAWERNLVPRTPATDVGSDMDRGWRPKETDQSVTKATDLILARAKETFPLLQNIHVALEPNIGFSNIRAMYNGSLKKFFGYRVIFNLVGKDKYGESHLFYEVGEVFIRKDDTRESSVFCTADSKGLKIPSYGFSTAIKEEYISSFRIGRMFTCEQLL